MVIDVDVPGFQAEDLTVNVLPGTVIVEGNASKKKSRKNEFAEYSESSNQTLFQRIRLPEAVLIDKAKAVLKNNRLRITLPLANKEQSQAHAAATAEPDVSERTKSASA